MFKKRETRSSQRRAAIISSPRINAQNHLSVSSRKRRTATSAAKKIQISILSNWNVSNDDNTGVINFRFQKHFSREKLVCNINAIQQNKGISGFSAAIGFGLSRT
mmetsp:Transcript_21849/g.54132  ORF Transcript_21849/g.54132 Transcript_21849/m.54132 type:complete len:105 (+) Transcript_21849:230-544(+)